MPKLSQQEIDAVLKKANLEQLGPYVGAGKPLLCLCRACGNEIRPQIASLKNGHGCKFCRAAERAARRRIPLDEARQIFLDAGVEPLDTYVNTGVPWRSRCLTCGEITSPTLANVKAGHKACKYCSGKAITLEKARSIYLEAGGKPTSKYPGTNAPWEGVCLTCDSTITPRLEDLKRGQGPCLKCGWRKSGAAQSLSALEAERRMVENGAQPLEDWANRGIDTPWLCECLKCGSTITPTIHSITNGQGPCVFCGRQKTAQKLSLRPEVAVDIVSSRGFIPLEPYPGAAVSWRLKCSVCNSTKSRRLANIQSGMGCRECSIEERRVSKREAESRLLAIGFKPLEPFTATAEPWLCECLKCGNTSYKRLGTAEQKQKDGASGCRYCGERTYGCLVYLIHHPQLRAYKIGVGKSRRVEHHLSHGWEKIEIWDLQSATAAYYLEGLLLDYVRKIWGKPQYLGAEEMPQGGQTETFSDLDLESADIVRLVGELKADTTQPR